MPDAVGYRATFGVVIPSTNTVVEHDYSVMRPHGVTFHAGRMYIDSPGAADDNAFEGLIQQIRGSTATAVRDVMTCEPDGLVMGMSAETFWGGKAGNEAFLERIRAMSGLTPTTGAEACSAACRELDVSRVAFLTPYQPVAEREVRRYFTEVGLDVVAATSLRCPSATAIARVPEDRLRKVLFELDRPDAEAIIQVGTNLSMLRLADEAERWLGKPVLAINAVTMWRALRSHGITDQLQGFGTMLREL